MRRLMLAVWCLALGAASSTVRAQEEILPRNPFWPQGYEGVRYPITLEPRFKPEPIAEPPPVVSTNAVSNAVAGVVSNAVSDAVSARAAAKARLRDPLEDPIWTNAVKSLDFGATVSYSGGGKTLASISINDRVYDVGDLVSSNFESHRFTWRIESLSSDRKLKLKRINYRKIGTNP